jgi:hypothetical protein
MKSSGFRADFHFSDKRVKEASENVFDAVPSSICQTDYHEALCHGS